MIHLQERFSRAATAPDSSALRRGSVLTRRSAASPRHGGTYRGRQDVAQFFAVEQALDRAALRMAVDHDVANAQHLDRVPDGGLLAAAGTVYGGTRLPAKQKQVSRLSLLHQVVGERESVGDEQVVAPPVWRQARRTSGFARDVRWNLTDAGEDFFHDAWASEVQNA